MKRLILASLAVAALASCSKESTVDVAITSAQIPIQYSAYAGSSATTKGAPIDSNTDFSATGNTFEVSAYAELGTADVGKYFNFSTITRGSSGWANTDPTYWPNESGTLYLGAYSPSGADGLDDSNAPSFTATSATARTLEILYTVYGDYPTSAGKSVSDQDDLMYAIANAAYTTPTKDESDEDTSADTETVDLHFKHALSQIAFTATKDAGIEVTVNSITLCNVMSKGIFTATALTADADTADGDATDSTVSDGYVDMTPAGGWSTATEITHYIAKLDGGAAVKVEAATNATTPTSLTDDDEVLMLIPQTLSPWVYTDAAGSTGAEGSLATETGDTSYLAIDCTIKHAGDGVGVNIIDGVVFVPFSTAGITYESGGSAEDGWKAGYKITYNLDFGGGYVDPTPGTGTTPTIPDPGKTPDPDDLVPTLRAITYTVSVDAWESASAGPSINVD